MKKVLMMVAALLTAVATMKAETEVLNDLNTESSNEVSSFSMANTDMAMLEQKKPLMAPPRAEGEKDAMYWGQTVLSRLKVMAYAQAGYGAVAYEGQKSDNQNTFDMKRCVLMVGADITPQFYAFFMHEFKNNSLQEYYMEYRPSKAFKVRLGQSKIEFSMENPMSPRVLENISFTATGQGGSSQAVSYMVGGDPLVNNGSGRDMGLMIYGDLFKDQLHYVFEVVNGGQINQNDKNNQKDLIGKLEYLPCKNFRLSVSGLKGYGYAVSKLIIYNPTVRVGETYHREHWAAGFEWRQGSNDYYHHRTASVRCEALGGRDGNCHSFGAYGSTTIPVYKQLDVVGSIDYLNRNTEQKYKQLNLMAGIQLWIFTKCRLQAQYAYNNLSDEMQLVTGKKNSHQFISQVQFSF